VRNFVCDALKRAKELVEQGWIRRYHYRCENGRKSYCAYWAIVTACTPEESGLRGVAVNVACVGAEDAFQFANRIRHIQSWNDRWWRTKRSVLAAFDKAIAYSQAN
jgi:hypothetical protein